MSTCPAQQCVFCGLPIALHVLRAELPRPLWGTDLEPASVASDGSVACANDVDTEPACCNVRPVNCCSFVIVYRTLLG